MNEPKDRVDPNAETIPAPPPDEPRVLRAIRLGYAPDPTREPLIAAYALRWNEDFDGFASEALDEE